MATKATSGKEGVESTNEKRAHYERIVFTVCKNGYVNVCNRSHNDDANHTYSVEVNNGEATGCSCPHAVHRRAHCKHQIAVENAPLVVSSASAASTRTVATDGGTTVETCDRCPKPLADVHDDHKATIVTTDGEELCPECADARSGEEIGFVDL